jgi:hypothetical protein
MREERAIMVIMDIIEGFLERGYPRMFSSIRVVDQMSSVTVRHDRKEQRNDSSMVHQVGMKYTVLRVEVGKVFVDKMTCTVGYGLI